MIIYYKGAGVLANVALIFHILFLLAILAAFKAVLTLPGIAGIVLIAGMAVDANVLINERIREELRAGRALVQLWKLATSTRCQPLSIRTLPLFFPD